MCDAILAGQREMAQMIVNGLRPQPGHSVGSNLQDTRNDGDVEGGHFKPKPHRGRGTKRRDRSENELSVSHTLFPSGSVY